MINYLNMTAEISVSINVNYSHAVVSQYKSLHYLLQLACSTTENTKNSSIKKRNAFSCREQVSSLRAVLRSNKISAESALECLRDKYESEKRLKDESMETLRRQLKQFKEDAATFASHRGMFTARCEELQGLVESAREGLRAAEQEKRTLNQLLRMAIQQKLGLMQRLEEVEMDRSSRQHLNLDASRHAPKRPNSHQQQHQQRESTFTRAVRYPSSTANISSNTTTGSANGNSSNSASARNNSRNNNKH